ncbi:DUF5681 domain-containing protein [Phenylobacterium sp.]|uniref:DUF5681 domain-containing protein n=1 Tax=Phenylobacterium sp. TaxID=1871053 RepID=UPI00286E4F96|nr:DUF5681 domain-containing protein [Phenylobacterium sp.]
MNEPQNTPGKTYKVGYGRPPLEHQFKPGQPSRNPRGRPRGRVREHALLRLMQEKVTISVEGKRKRMTFEEALSRKFIHTAQSGNPQVYKAILQATILLEKAYATRAPTRAEILQEMADEKFRAESQEKLRGVLICGLEHMAAANKPERSAKPST